MSTEATRIPAPLYAAAGAGDLAYKQLRKLPARAAQLRERVAASDIDKLRDAAMRNANLLLSNAQVAQERVGTFYADLVKHGARVVAARAGADETVATKAAAKAKPARPKAKAVVASAKPVKRQRATTAK